jgi:Tetratricopeptide repeat
VKALYRRAQAYLGTGDFSEAERDIKKALQVRAVSRPPPLLPLSCPLVAGPVAWARCEGSHACISAHDSMHVPACSASI